MTTPFTPPVGHRIAGPAVPWGSGAGAAGPAPAIRASSTGTARRARRGCE
ncbi:hypothetical protein [Nonomuraea sp. NPDC049141]